MRLVSFNVLHGMPTGPGEAAKLPAAVAALEADVLGLQEVDRGQPRSGGGDLTAELAAAGGWPEARFAAALVGTPGGAWRAATDDDDTGTGTGAAADGPPLYGVALLTRLPVTAWHVVRLPAAPVRSPVVVPGPRVLVLPDEPRVGLAAVVRTPTGLATVATTHLSFVPGWNLWQLRLLTRALRRYPAPRFLLGDLNVPGGLAGPASGWQELDRGSGVRTFPAANPRVAVDHVLADGGVQRVAGVRAVTMPVSDHQALVVDVVDPPSGLR